jgi:site-specific DNA recombinase
MRVAIYARYSSELQRDASIEDQVRLCRDHAACAGWAVVETFADHALSGATTNRPAFQQLTAAVRAGQFDAVLAESLDRFSRDLEHIAAFHKLCVFQRVRIQTVAEGEVSELHVGLKGTMGALYLKDLADKTRRGLEGRVRAGRAVGLPPYGYEVVRQLDDRGELDRGLRAIDPAKAAIVRRVFHDYATGVSPRRIAQAMNTAGVAGPAGGIWYASSIIGRPKRHDGLLRNELYVGRMVWRRKVNAKDPTNGQKRQRYAAAADLVVTEVPQLRIVDGALWHRVQDRLAAEAAPPKPGTTQSPYWERRRPRHLLSGKVICGACGRPLGLFGQDYLRCPAARVGSCRNNARIRRGKLEAWVLEALERQLMAPDLVAAFVEAFNDRWRALAAEAKAQEGAQQRERAAVERKIANIVEATADGRSSPALLTRLAELEAQKAVLERLAPTNAKPAPPALHPGIANVYARQVDRLKQALAAGSDAEALEAARALIDKVVVYPPDTDGGPPGLELHGELMAMLKAAGLECSQEGDSRPDLVLAAFASSIKSDPGGQSPSWPCFL